LAFWVNFDDDEATHLLPSAIDLVASGFRQPHLELSAEYGAASERRLTLAVFAAVEDLGALCRHPPSLRCAFNCHQGGQRLHYHLRHHLSARPALQNTAWEHAPARTFVD
jgi:hypothetical protein